MSADNGVIIACHCKSRVCPWRWRTRCLATRPLSLANPAAVRYSRGEASSRLSDDFLPCLPIRLRNMSTNVLTGHMAQIRQCHDSRRGSLRNRARFVKTTKPDTGTPAPVPVPP